MDPLESKDIDKVSVKGSDVYNKSEVDLAPMLGKCIDEKNPLACTDINIRKIIKTEIDYPDAALAKGHDGLETVIFVIDENGKVDGYYKVLSKEKPCEECAQAAVEEVAQLPDFTPGIKNGKAVKTKVAIPVRFKIVK